jgi:cysteine-rich repeat protein
MGGPAPAVASENIVLGPVEAINEVRFPHTVVSIVTDGAGLPVAGRQVDFAILSGPHAGTTGAGVTVADGRATFTYTGTTTGFDTIIASLVDSLGSPQNSNQAFKRWELPICGNGMIDPGEDCEPGMFCAGGCNPVLGFCFDIPCNDDCTCPCGNGIAEPGEECDDGNRVREDGCSSGCRIEWCPLGAGFWKNHPTAWETDSLELGKETYGKDELLAILGSPTATEGAADASLTLARQMIAAKLNVARGSALTSEIVFAFVLRDPFFEFPGRLPYHVDPDSPLGEEMLSAAAVLERYNKGKFTPDCVTRTREERRRL